MSVNNNYTKEKVGCNSCDYQEVPFQTICNVNDKYSRCKMVNQNGVGIKNVATQNIETFN
jgi:hypothetical protein